MKRMEWYPLLSPELLQNAYKSGNNSQFELAWPKEQALRVIDMLHSKGLRVISVEPWLPTYPGPTPLGIDWVPNHIKLAKTAAEFIASFTYHPAEAYNSNLKPVFNISADSI